MVMGSVIVVIPLAKRLVAIGAGDVSAALESLDADVLRVHEVAALPAGGVIANPHFEVLDHRPASPEGGERGSVKATVMGTA